MDDDKIRFLMKCAGTHLGLARGLSSLCCVLGIMVILFGIKSSVGMVIAVPVGIFLILWAFLSLPFFSGTLWMLGKQNEQLDKIISLLVQTHVTETVVHPLSDTIDQEVFARMIKVQAGVFVMGSGKEEHKVTISHDYFVCRYEVTQTLYEAVTGENPSKFKGPNLPVESISWNDAMAFCKKLNGLTDEKRPTGYEFTLPTEAQWEFAARGGIKSKGYEYSGSNNIEDVAWNSKNSGGKTHLVGQLKPNELGIYDMSGNVWEWCLDRYVNYEKENSTDHTDPSSSSDYVVRGGSWDNSFDFCQVVYRDCDAPANCYASLGFRLVLSPVQQEQEATD